MTLGSFFLLFLIFYKYTFSFTVPDKNCRSYSQWLYSLWIKSINKSIEKLCYNYGEIVDFSLIEWEGIDLKKAEIKLS